ncbi:methyltransferase [Legionella gresilensis]|uniref:methyltransferase n=1 Tax=Legionella gresilensis TaxID=91823 RepID=UPI001041A39B|nr:methyltransferase [Legionella gresilensis]
MLIILISIILISLILLFLYQNRTSKAIKKWQRALQLHIHQPIFDKLYEDVNGFVLSKAARAHHDAIEYTYGEIEFESFIALLSLCKLQPNTVFYDLGSGTGKAVIACTMVFDICKSYGIELFLPLHKCAQKQLQRLAQIESYQDKAKKIILKHENFLDSSIQDGTIIFINATTFIAELWEQISKHVEQVKPGTLVISTSKLLTSKCFAVTRIVPLKVSWGVINAYIQQRIED